MSNLLNLKKFEQSFEHFITGVSNRLAFAACKAICEQPSNIYNPLFITGPQGSGKTHLLKAIEKESLILHPHLKVKFFDLDFFQDLFIHADTEDLIEMFRKETREGDIFLFDNLDHLQQNEATKEEFFHTFNDIFQNRKQVVISSALSTKEMTNFPVRLISRLEWGLSTVLLEPHFETRILIYEKLFEINQIAFEKDLLKELAAEIERNIEKMQDFGLDIIKFSHKNDQSLISKEIFNQYLSKNKEEKVFEAQKIQQVVSRFFNVNPVELLSKSRLAKTVEARHIAIYLIRKFTKHTLKEVGILFGRRHHTTIMHAEQEIENRIKINKDFSQLINQLIQQLSV